MEFSLINIEDKLKSYRRFAECQGVILAWKNELYSYPSEIKENANPILEHAKGGGLAQAFEDGLKIAEFPMNGGRLFFLDPDNSTEKRTLKFLAKDLEESLQLAITFDSIFKAARTISSDLRLRPLLDRVMSLSEEILDVEVSSVLLLKSEEKELYWEISRGKGSDFFCQNVTIPLGEGITGSVAQNGEPIMLNDVHKDSRWCPSYDWKSGFRTRSMLCVPLKYHGKILGVISAINKRKGKFTNNDLWVLECIAGQAAIAIENARVYGELDRAFEELKALDKARGKVIHHLSHEIKTPLAVLSGVMEKISRDMKNIRMRSLDRTLDRGRRNLNRLLNIQSKIDDIINYKPIEEEASMLNIIENVAALLDEMGEDARDQYAEILELISDRIKSLFGTDATFMEEISLQEFLDQVCDEAVFLMQKRELHIERRFEKDALLIMDRKVLRKVMSGLLRNAIENTPDQGRIEVVSSSVDGHISLEVRDYGIGITPQNQKMIFGGFFHTQDTAFYTSKKPYEFDAGGSGADLLRTKVFSERFGFSIELHSTRCQHIPEESDTCPGNISLCAFVKSESECLLSGGSIFTIKFLKALQEQGKFC